MTEAILDLSRPFQRRAVLALGWGLLATLVLTGCGDGGPGSDDWEAAVDTLANGAVHVSNPAEGRWAEGEGWQLVEEVRIGSASEDGPDLFGQIAALEMGEDGRIYVLERQSRELRIFAPDGEHLRTVGREGGGPGEFRDVIGLGWHADGELWVVDPGNGRFSVFTPEGDFVRTHPRTMSGYSMPWPGGFGREGEVFEVGFVPGAQLGTSAVIRFGDGMKSADTIPVPVERETEQFVLETENGRTSATVPFAPFTVWRLDPTGFLWHGFSSRYRLTRTGLDGDTLLVVERTFEPEPVTAEEREEALENLEWFRAQGGEVDARRIPSEKPAFYSVLVADDGHIFVVPGSRPGEGVRSLDVFDPDGYFLGELDVEPPLSPTPFPVIRGDRVLAVVRDELGTPYVVRYRIER
ncbi:MAG: 6-bladed beta-propeller [Gemmatimonadota bacterium]